MIIEVTKEHILNEDVAAVTASYNLIGYNNQGFSYSIMPLLFNLCQRGNDKAPKDKNTSYKHFVGDMVTGYCPYDKNKHTGIIKYLYFKTDDSMNGKPTYVYVQDMTNNDIIPLEPDSVQKVAIPRPHGAFNTNYLVLNASHMCNNSCQGNGCPAPGGPVMKETYELDFNKPLND